MLLYIIYIYTEREREREGKEALFFASPGRGMRIQRCSKEPPAAEDTHHARRKSEVKEEGQRKETKPIINLLYKQKERERERLLCTNILNP